MLKRFLWDLSSPAHAAHSRCHPKIGLGGSRTSQEWRSEAVPSHTWLSGSPSSRQYMNAIHPHILYDIIYSIRYTCKPRSPKSSDRYDISIHRLQDMMPLQGPGITHRPIFADEPHDQLIIPEVVLLRILVRHLAPYGRADLRAARTSCLRTPCWDKALELSRALELALYLSFRALATPRLKTQNVHSWP